MQDVIVIGGCHHNMLGVLRSLGQKGINSYVIIETNEETPYVLKSKYIKFSWKVRTENEVLDILRKYVYLFPSKPVVIACSDNLSSLLDQNKDELSKHYFIPGAEKQGVITCLMNKEEMIKLAADSGFLIPQSTATDTNSSERVNISMPWIVKPLVSKDGAKSDIERIYSYTDWENYKKKHGVKVQVQQLIDKEFEYQLIGLSLYGGSEVIIPGVSHVIRPAATTNTGFLHYEPLNKSFESVVKAGKDFLKATTYSGLFSLEFLRGKDGKDYFMEINFRNDGNAICVTAAGVNLPYIWYLYNVSGNYRSEIENRIIKPVYIMPEFSDLSYMIHGKLGFFTWIKDIIRTDSYMEFDFHDQKPFWTLFFQRLFKRV